MVKDKGTLYMFQPYEVARLYAEAVGRTWDEVDPEPKRDDHAWQSWAARRGQFDYKGGKTGTGRLAATICNGDSQPIGLVKLGRLEAMSKIKPKAQVEPLDAVRKADRDRTRAVKAFDASIVAAHAAGKSYREIAGAAGISFQRVAQIVAASKA